ncbi:porin [Achromobacter anxifer]
MKKIGLSLSLLVVAPPAFAAQSSVELYGMLDSGITYVSGGGKGSSIHTDICGPQGCNRFGLRGREDLGDGVSTVFVLENGFNLQNGKLGQGGLLFGRQAYVGFSSERYGVLTLGRQYDPLSDTVGMFPSSNNFATGYGSHFGDLNNLNQSIRINNAVKYVSPNANGLRLHSMYSFGGQTGDFAANRSWALAGSYASGPLAMAVGYLDIHPPATRANGTGGVYESNGSYVGALGQYVGLQDADAMKVLGVGASYQFGAATVGFTYARTLLRNSQYFVVNGFPGAGNGGDFTMDSYELMTTYRLTPAFSFGVAYIYNAGRADYQKLKPKFHQVNLGASYTLSKRTELYSAVILQKAGGDGIAPVLGAGGAVVGRSAIAEIPGAGADSGSSRQSLVTMGFSHRF